MACDPKLHAPQVRGRSQTTKSPPSSLHYCRRKRALLWELAQLAKNAIAFNEEDSLIVKHAQVLVQTLWKFIELVIS